MKSFNPSEESTIFEYSSRPSEHRYQNQLKLTNAMLSSVPAIGKIYSPIGGFRPTLYSAGLGVCATPQNFLGRAGSAPQSGVVVAPVQGAMGRLTFPGFGALETVSAR